MHQPQKHMTAPILTALACLLTVASGCSGAKLNKFDVTNRELPPEIAKEDKEKFEIKEAPQQQSGIVASTQVVAVKPKPKKPKKKLASVSKAQEMPFRRPSPDPIWIGEKLVYDVSYFGVSAGEFTLEIPSYKVINNRKVYYIHGNAVTSKLFSLFYRMNDTVESFLDYDGWFSHRLRIVLDESKQTQDSVELYDWEKGKTFFWKRLNRINIGLTEDKKWEDIKPFNQDTLSALYYMRSLPMPDGAVIEIPVVSEAHSFDGILTVVRREKTSSPMGDVPCVVLKVHTRHQGMLKNQGDNYLWITDDSRKILVRLEAKVKVGTVVGQLKAFTPGTPPQ